MTAIYEKHLQFSTILEILHVFLLFMTISIIYIYKDILELF